MATPGPEDMVLLNSQAGSDAAVAFHKMAGHHRPPSTLSPLVARIKLGTAEQMKRGIDKLQCQIDADKAEIEELIKRIEDLKGDQVFESDLYWSCRELIYMRYARGFTPLSSVESTRLKEIHDLACQTVGQYEAANGNLPAVVNPFIHELVPSFL